VHRSVERGETNPTLGSLATIARTLKIPTSKLLEGVHLAAIRFWSDAGALKVPFHELVSRMASGVPEQQRARRKSPPA
jgi:hypothetical protein